MTGRRRVNLVSFTSLDASGGVPRWNRDVKAALEADGWDVRHFSWTDDPISALARFPEWDAARRLNTWLLTTGRVDKDDVFIVDGFWGLGLEHCWNVVSVSHGNWSHTTKDDVDAGVSPEFPQHHAVQVDFRRRHLDRGGRMVAVSRFIADQCLIQWGFVMPVINNGIDLATFTPARSRVDRARPIVVHATTTANKGFNHIEHIRTLDVDVLSIDEAVERFMVPKHEAIAQADVAVHPSAHEGNSYSVAEFLACGVPLVSYDVGYVWELRELYGFGRTPVGIILDRRHRRPESTAAAVDELLRVGSSCDPRGSAVSIEQFNEAWRAYVAEEFPR